MTKPKPTPATLVSMIAFATVLNLIGAKAALLLRLPVYLDTMGTFLITLLFGGIPGSLTAVFTGLINGATGDAFALYFIPSGVLFALMCRGGRPLMKAGIWGKFLYLLVITLPSTALSAVVAAGIFGGVTSSASSPLALFLYRTTPLSLPVSVFLLQLGTDLLDRGIGLVLVPGILKKIPSAILAAWRIDDESLQYFDR